MTNHTPQTLMAFTERVKQAFLAKKIRCPVHLNSEDQAEPLIDIFKSIQPTDWVFSNWRSMWHALLHGIQEDELFDTILQGRSMYIMSAKHRFMASSIVGGMLPIACGVAAGIKRKPRDYLREARDGGMYGLPSPGECVNVFVGDMTWSTGLFQEFQQYCMGYDLPVRVFIENNGLSTNTPTFEAWGEHPHDSESKYSMHRYEYERTGPHVGVGERVQF
jgi:TPP-dependent pyruvate/acetoin dehydrogenase alpha subunit